MSFLLQTLAVLVSVGLAGHISQLLGQPSVLGQLLVGVVLGPALLGWLTPTPLIDEMAEIGVILLMFLAGLETHLPDFRRSAGPATLVAIGGVALPFVGGWATAELWGYSGVTATFIGVLLAATSVSISVQTLRELGQLKSRPGVTILAAAVLDDILGIIVLSLVLALAGGTAGAAAAAGGHGTDSLGLVLVKMLVFFVVAGGIGWKLLPWLLRWMSQFRVGASVLVAGIVAAVGYAYAAESLGLAGIIGAYLAGLIMSEADTKERLLHGIEDTAFSFFVPFFFVSVGLAARMEGLSGNFLIFVAALAGVAIVTKLIGGGLGAMLAGFKFRPALGVGAGMVARGEVGLIVAAIGLERGLLVPELYTAMVLVTLATTLVTPPLLKLVFRSGKVASPQA